MVNKRKSQRRLARYSVAPKERDFSGSVLGVIALMLGVIALTFYFIVTPSKVNGYSMAPTLANDQQVLFKRRFKADDIKRGTIVVFNAPDADASYIKRVIGLPGDIVEYKKDVLYINGKSVAEPYLTKNKEALHESNKYVKQYMTDFKVKVGKDRYFVLGDNRLFSSDSRVFGAIKYKSIYGIELKANIPLINERRDLS